MEKSKPEAERLRGMDEKTARDMENITGKFGNIGQMALLSGRPRRRGA